MTFVQPTLDAGKDQVLADLQSAVQNLRSCSGAETIGASLKAAASLVEHAAYELARLDGPQNVASLILLAAEIERSAQVVATMVPRQPMTE